MAGVSRKWMSGPLGGVALALCLLGGAAQAACEFGSPEASALDTYGYVQDWSQNIQIPVTCDGGSEISGVRISSGDGSVDLATGRFLGLMRSGNDRLAYSIANATQLRVVNGRLRLEVTVPGGQWGAPTGTYTDALTVTVDF